MPFYGVSRQELHYYADFGSLQESGSLDVSIAHTAKEIDEPIGGFNRPCFNLE